VVSGASIEKDVDSNFSGKKSFRLSLNNPDFTTAARLAVTINGELGGKFATARDSATIDVVVPFNYEGNTVEMLAALENMQINVDGKAKVVLNERTGTIVMGERVSLTPVAIAHGDLSIEVKGGTAGQRERLIDLKGAASVSDLVKSLNALGVQPRDLTAIFQTLRETGALQADLEIL
jgi:flagellar P-ring protein precursor FlgI